MTTASNLLIRPAAAGDAPTLGKLGAALVEIHHAFDAPRFIAPSPQTEDGYGEFLDGERKRKKAVVLVAEQAGAVVGYAYGALEGRDWLSLRGPAGVIYDLLVDPTHRGGGVGRALLDALAEALLSMGAPQLVLFAASRNEGAQRLFASAGFRPTMVEMTRDRP